MRTVPIPAELRQERNCHLTARGRVTGRTRTVELWFAATEHTCYIIAGGRDRAHWVQNLSANPTATVRIGNHTFPVSARLNLPSSAERTTAIEMIYTKYHLSAKLDELQRGAYVVALDVQGEA